MTLTDTTACTSAACKSAMRHAVPVSFGQQVKDFFSGLFDTSNWPPRWHCGTWSDFHGWLYIISDLLIWASYFAIPVMLILMVKRRSDIPFPKLIWLFGAFIILCGSTHLVDAIIFWWPAYRVSALLRLFTAIISMVSVYALYKILPQVKTLRTVKDLEREMEERRKLEEKVAQSEFLMSEAGRLGRLGGWEVDLLTGKAVWSKAIYQIYELPLDYPTEDHDIERFYPKPYSDMLTRAIENAHKYGEKWDLELQMLTASHRLIWVRSYGEVYTDRNGKKTRLRGLFMDIDRYKSSELQLSKSVELVSQHNIQLKNFTHILSHNIRNHASNISLVSSLVDTESLTEFNAELFEKIKKVSNALNETLSDLSQAIRIRDSFLKSDVFRFSDVTHQVLEVIESDITANNAKITLQFGVDKVSFPGIYLESIIMNLLTNALKYRKEDAAPEILLKSYKDENGRTVLSCQDNGLGIDLALHGKKIFGLYKTFHERKDAHGVGLFLTKTQIESQGGEIAVESVPGVGSTFKIIFNE